MKLISVIVPVYNVEKYLSKCLESIINQTYQNLEIICVDDGSTDSSPKILEEYAKKDTRIKIVEKLNAEDEVLSRAFSLLSGDFVGFVRGKDYISANFFETMYNSSIENNADVVTTSLSSLEKGVVLVTSELTIDTDKVFERKLNKLFNDFCGNKLYRRSFLQKYNISYPEDVADSLFLIKVMYYSKNAAFINNSCYYYRNASDNFSEGNKKLKSEKLTEDINSIIKFCKENSLNKRQKFHIKSFLNRVEKFYFADDKDYTSSIDSLLDSNFPHKLSFIDRLFYVYMEKEFSSNQQVINFFGIKISRKLPKIDRIFCKKFLNRKIKPKTVLFVELNKECHCEVLPGYIKYLNDLGYVADVLISNTQEYEKPLYFAEKTLQIENIFNTTSDTMIHILRNRFINKYDYVFFTSTIVYYADWSKALDLIKPHHIRNSNIILTEHHIDIMRKNQEDYSGKKCVILPVYKFDAEDVNYVSANPHYFGDFKTTQKNDTPIFLMAGALEASRKNVKILFDALNSLVDNGNTNFRIVVIGRGEMDDIPEKIRPFFEIKGRVDYPTLYSEVNNADFFLPLLDPENPDHDRYIKDGTSGAFQLIYGFAKPCLINKKFAEVHGFDSENSIVYDKKSDLAGAMADAINMSKEEYEKKQTKLKEYAAGLYKKSLENLRGLLK